MSESEHPQLDADDHLFELFDTLRQQVIHIGDDFRGSLRRRLDAVERDDSSARLGAVITTMLIETINLFGGSLDRDESEGEGDDDG